MRQMNKKQKAYSILEILVTLAIFGILSVFLMQSLFMNLTLSSRISARSQIRSELDQLLSLIEKDIRNADEINKLSCAHVNTTNPRCESSCTMKVGSEIITWCYDNRDIAGKKLIKYSGTFPNYTKIYETSNLFQIDDLEFAINLDDVGTTLDFNPYINVVLTLNASNENLGIKDQIRQLSITTRNYRIK